MAVGEIIANSSNGASPAALLSAIDLNAGKTRHLLILNIPQTADAGSTIFKLVSL